MTDSIAETALWNVRPDQNLPIPSEDLTRQYVAIRDEVLDAVARVLPGGKYTMGPALAAFEREWADECRTAEAIGVSSGTAALMLAFKAVGVGPGDEVIVPALTYVATAFAVSYLGGVPVFVDVDEHTFNIDPEQVEVAISPKTKAICPVHLYGQPADMDALREIAVRHGLALIEDAAQAHQAEYKGARVGGIGDIGCFSFYPHKNLGAYGDGGAVTTNDADLAQLVRALRYMGQREKHKHEMLGFQERLDELQAAILSVRLRHLAQWTALRQRWAALYDELLADTPVVTPARRKDRTHVYYMYTIKAPDRDGLMAHLKSHGIGSQIIYPTAVPDQGAYAVTPCRVASCERARRLTSQILCLPVFPELREEEVRTVASAVSDFYTVR
jgi:dTDP-4-amino-4,6-dideoxygalactose transaminase